MGHRHLFAYGPYLDENLLRERCPDPEFLTLAHYDSRRFMINSDGLATACPRRGYRLYGVVWSVQVIGLAALDIHAGVPHQHDRFGSFARTANGQLCVAEFYAARTAPRAEPTPPISSRSSRLPGAGSFPNNTSKRSPVEPGWSRTLVEPSEVHDESIYSRQQLPTKAPRADELRRCRRVPSIAAPRTIDPTTASRVAR
jgi:hypothetical protein